MGTTARPPTPIFYFLPINIPIIKQTCFDDISRSVGYANKTIDHPLNN